MKSAESSNLRKLASGDATHVHMHMAPTTTAERPGAVVTENTESAAEYVSRHRAEWEGAIAEALAATARARSSAALRRSQRKEPTWPALSNRTHGAVAVA